MGGYRCSANALQTRTNYRLLAVYYRRMEFIPYYQSPGSDEYLVYAALIFSNFLFITQNQMGCTTASNIIPG